MPAPADHQRRKYPQISFTQKHLLFPSNLLVLHSIPPNLPIILHMLSIDLLQHVPQVYRIIRAQLNTPSSTFSCTSCNSTIYQRPDLLDRLQHSRKVSHGARVLEMLCNAVKSGEHEEHALNGDVVVRGLGVQFADVRTANDLEG